MPLHAVPTSELREHCRQAIEALEYWLRRLIDDELSARYGADYLDAVGPGGERVIRKQMALRLKDLHAKEPNRFPRAIDAAFIEDEIYIICKHKDCFKEAFSIAFPDGREEIRTFLERLIRPRNALSHGNPISVHDAYRVLCYTMDVIESMKGYYVSKNKDQQYNVPMVIQIRDSRGHIVHFSDPTRVVGNADFSTDPASYLRCGDTISIEVDVDPSFDPADYRLDWAVSNIGGGPHITGAKYTLLLEPRFVSERLTIVCRVFSNKGWHRHGTHDDQVEISYKVLPPV